MERTFKLSFGADNAAFDDNLETEIARILREIADRVERDTAQSLCGKHKTIWDINGNNVGTFVLKCD